MILRDTETQFLLPSILSVSKSSISFCQRAFLDIHNIARQGGRLILWYSHRGDGSTTIDVFFRPAQQRLVAPNAITFLNLPYNLLLRIYLYTGLLSESVIHLNYIAAEENECTLAYVGVDPEEYPAEQDICARSQSLSHFLDGPLPWPKIYLNRRCPCMEIHGQYYDWCKCDALPYRLLYVSRFVAEEVSSIFYSENYFSVCRSEIGGLSVLLSLPPKAIGWITSLSIRLNICGCPGYETSLNSFKSDREDHQLNCHLICRVRGYELSFRKATSRQQKGRNYRMGTSLPIPSSARRTEPTQTFLRVRRLQC